MSRGKRGHAFALLLVLMTGTFAVLAPPAEAQQPAVVIWFPQRETDTGVFRDDPDFLQGEDIEIRVRGATGQPWVRVRCLENCHDVANREYYARWLGNTLVFPRSFTEAGPATAQDVGNAVVDQVPKFNGTWEVTVLLSPGSSTRQMNIWLVDFFRSEGAIAQPGATYTLHGRGFDASEATLRIEHKGADGQFSTIHGPLGLSSQNSRLMHRWEVPKSEASRILACREKALDCTTYRLTITGGGKPQEQVLFVMEPASLWWSPVEPTSGTARTVQRSQNLTAEYIFYYPGGTHFLGDAFGPQHQPASSVTPPGTMRVRVENATVGGNYVVDEATMSFQDATQTWRVSWSVPKDLQLPSSGRASYQLVLPETRDAWGNRIQSMVLANFTITSATLTPVLLQNFDQLPRTELGEVALQLAYLNGSYWTNEDNATPLRGCFVRTESLPTCTERNRVTGRYAENGTWVFEVRYPYDHSELASYRFVFPDGTRDKWGNTVQRTEGVPYEVVVGSPHVSFKTIQQGLDVTTLERGHRVSITVHVNYGDGSPYNHTVAPNESRVLNVTLSKRAQSGEVVDERILSLAETDRTRGRYFAVLDLTRDEATTPLGVWDFRFDVEDIVAPPNRNLTTFTREIVAAPIVLQPLSQPAGNLPTGALAKFRFRLVYEDGSEVQETHLAQRIEARLHAHNGTAPIGLPLSPRLIPQYENGAWTVQYTIPNELYQGRYGFVLTGADRFGNLVSQTAFSRPFTTYAEPRERSVLTQPGAEIARGEAAVVVFDGDPDDMGPLARDLPVIRVERYDGVRKDWVVEVADARRDGFDGDDHYAVFDVLETTTIGTYRFVMVGRDRDFRPINATSHNITVAATEVQRAILVPPPKAIVKGDQFSFAIERRDGDTLRETTILYNGRALRAQPPVTSIGPGSHNVTWQVPFDAPTGNYSILITGRDVFGNTIQMRSPSVEALPAQLQGSLLGAPLRLVERGERVSVLFGITYPTGAFYQAQQLPEAVVTNADGPLTNARVDRNNLVFDVSWVPPADTPAGEYWFEISGRGEGGNLFPSLRSETFRIASGQFSRDITADVQPTYTRGQAISLAVAYSPRDELVEFELEYYGTVQDAEDVRGREPRTTTTLQHRVEPATGRYIAEFPTDLSTPVGGYRFVMSGRDGEGNDIRAESRLFLLRTVPIRVNWEGLPPSDAFDEGKTITLRFSLEYIGAATRAMRYMDPSVGTPNVAILYMGRPITERPDVTYEDGKWALTWDIPDSLLPGAYSFVVGGADINGNGIQSAQSTNYPFEADVKESFGKVIPAPHGLLLVLGLATAALVVRRRR